MDFKVQLVDIDQNRLFDFIASFPPHFFGAFENPSLNFQERWQPRHALVAPFVTAFNRSDSIYADPCFADLDGDSDCDLLVLKQNYPNPFNRGTIISYEVPHVSHVQLKIYDLLGRRVATLVDDKQGAGKHVVVWHADNIASGVYSYEMRFGANVEHKIMELLR